VATRAFPDHHRFSRADVDRIEREAREAGAALILTTEKDMMRLLPWRPLSFPAAWVPLKVDVTPTGVFGRWLLEALQRARDGRAAATGLVPLPGSLPASTPAVSVPQ
jgi:tetraacyldisaccharide 4'-kinase